MTARFLSKHQRTPPLGQGLLEVILAVAIAAIGLGASMSLIIVAGLRGRTTSNQAVAINLAREGIEVLRSIRDSNWLKTNVAFDTGLVGPGSKYYGTFNFTPTVGWSLNWLVYNVGNEYPDVSSQLYELGGFFQQKSTGPGGTASRYRRIFFAKTICGPVTAPVYLGDNGNCPVGSSKIGVDAEVRVQWNENGATRVARLEETLFDWRP